MAITNYDKLVSLLPFNEPDESTTVYDYSYVNATPTLFGNAKVDNAVGYLSMLCDGNGDYSKQVSTNFNISGSFTLRCKARPSSLAAVNGLMFVGTFGQDASRVQVYIGTDGTLNFYATSSGNAQVFLLTSSASAILANTEYDIEAVVSGSNVYLFKDGTLVASGTVSGTIGVGNEYYVGYARTGSVNRFLTGNIRDAEFYNGAALHTSGFTPPSAGSLVKTLSGNVKDDTNANAARAVQAVSRQTYNGRPVAFSTTSDGSTGNYSLKVPDIGSEEWTRLFLDNAAGTVYNDLVLGRGTPV